MSGREKPLYSQGQSQSLNDVDAARRISREAKLSHWKAPAGLRKLLATEFLRVFGPKTKGQILRQKRQITQAHPHRVGS